MHEGPRPKVLQTEALVFFCFVGFLSEEGQLNTPKYLEREVNNVHCLTHNFSATVLVILTEYIQDHGLLVYQNLRTISICACNDQL